MASRWIDKDDDDDDYPQYPPCRSVTWVQEGPGEPNIGKFHPHYCGGEEGHAGPHGCDCGVEWIRPFLPPKRPDYGPKEVRAMMRGLIGK